MSAPSAARADLERDGFCVVHDVAPPGLCAAIVREVERFLGLDLDEPATYTRMPERNSGIVPLHHTQAQWDVRQHPALHRVFAELWGSERLWVSFDRTILRLPSSESPAAELELHWDRDPRLPERFLQGMLYLEDTPRERAPTTVAPPLFRELERLLESGRADTKEWTITAGAGEWLPVAGRTGSLVVWDARMPHGPSLNESSRPRISQAVTMFPPAGDAAKNAAAFLGKELPEEWRGWAGQIYPEPGPPATLTALGRKLVGFDAW